ncbi:hypothetical protein [Bradyrhizobium sp. Ec3.3]|uniref:hypothetical protein n=1 Tax=Bradyrhizobium sp. Ec3.3 TaxID=189753 RepID=UPI000486A1EF|nr:hypothetical protein [Bradyrhizobium sp. Ec3.3]
MIDWEALITLSTSPFSIAVEPQPAPLRTRQANCGGSAPIIDQKKAGVAAGFLSLRSANFWR